MPDIDELLQIDFDNVPATKDVLRGLSADFPDALETAAAMYNTFARCITGRLDRPADLENLTRCAHERGLVLDELVDVIANNRDTPEMAPARTAYERIRSGRIRVCVYLLLQWDLPEIICLSRE